MEVTSPRSEAGETLLERGSAVAKTVADKLLTGRLTAEDSSQLSQALVTLRSATNYLEGTARFEEAHEALDYAGRVQRVAFRGNCALHESNGTYSQQCPVALAHNRVGVSVGMIIEESHCSICGQDPDLCFHITGRQYDGSRCYRIITKAKADHFAFVEHPDFPDARITAVPVSIDELTKKLGVLPPPGTPIYCDRCLSPCSGVSRPFQKRKVETRRR